MAKSARASRTKRNNQALKKKVFGPVVAARNERLHAKLLDLAKASKEEVMKEVDEEPEVEQEKKDMAEQDIDMDDTASIKATKSKREIQRLRAARAERIEKSRRRKPRNQITFPTHPKKKKGTKR